MRTEGGRVQRIPGSTLLTNITYMRKLPTNYRRVRLAETDTAQERELIRVYLQQLCLRRGVRTPKPWMYGIVTAWARSVLAYPRDRTWGCAWLVLWVASARRCVTPATYGVHTRNWREPVPYGRVVTCSALRPRGRSRAVSTRSFHYQPGSQ